MTTEQASAQAYMADARNDKVLVYVNGAFVPRNEARISVFDSGFVLGDGVREIKADRAMMSTEQLADAELAELARAGRPG